MDLHFRLLQLQALSCSKHSPIAVGFTFIFLFVKARGTNTTLREPSEKIIHHVKRIEKFVAILKRYALFNLIRYENVLRGNAAV